MAFLSRPAANLMPATDTVMLETDLIADNIMPVTETATESEESLVFPAESTPVLEEAVLFEDIVERYHGKVFQLVYRYIGDYDEASDLTQDTFVRAYSAWRDFRGESQVYPWL